MLGFWMQSRPGEKINESGFDKLIENCPETLIAGIVPMSKDCGYTKAICPQLQGGRGVGKFVQLLQKNCN